MLPILLDSLTRRFWHMLALFTCTAQCAAAASPPACDSAALTRQGFDAMRLCALLDDFQTSSLNLHGLVIERDGVLVAERYRTGKDRSVYALWPGTVAFTASTRHDLRSVSKSITALLWGIADADHQAPPLDTKVLDLLPQLADLKTAGRTTIRIDDLLTMQSGLAWSEDGGYGWRNPELGLYWRGSQARYLFDRPVQSPPGTVFNYNGGNTAVLAQLLNARVGMSLSAYASSRLFVPLGISDWEWLDDLRGRPLAFSGLRMRSRDLAKIGRLVLQHGQWEGRQIVPAAWIDAMLQPRTDAGHGRQYGYQWWLGKVATAGGERSWAAAYGNGGQRLYIVPSLGLVVVLTAGMYNDEAGAIAVNKLLARIAGAAGGPVR